MKIPNRVFSTTRNSNTTLLVHAQTVSTRCGTIFFFTFFSGFILLTANPIPAEWPYDAEPYGLLGCKILRFRGLWEEVVDSSKLDESTEGKCIAIAIANLMLYHRWPQNSYFDGYYRTCRYSGLIKPIRYQWHYDLITGNGNVQDCINDNPKDRSLPDNYLWTGLDEIRQLVYAVERSYGHDNEYFRTKDNACEGIGYFPIDHLLRNRLGYPLCATIRAMKPAAQGLVIQNIQARLPVIGMKCQHVYVIDGYKKDPKTGAELFHSSDYIMGEESMGWFTWRHFLREGLERIVFHINPDYRLLKGPSSGKITYLWGDVYVPGTSNTQRRGRIEITRMDNKHLGAVAVRLTSEDLSPYTNENSNIIFQCKDTVASNIMSIPPGGTFPFGIGEATSIVLSLTNNDKEGKIMRIVFRDFESDSTTQ